MPKDPTEVFCNRPRNRVDAAVGQGLSVLAGLALGGSVGGGGKADAPKGTCSSSWGLVSWNGQLCIPLSLALTADSKGVLPTTSNVSVELLMDVPNTTQEITSRPTPPAFSAVAHPERGRHIFSRSDSTGATLSQFALRKAPGRPAGFGC